ncbi:nitrogen regulation protein NR(I) [Thiosulfativibrio zosterae]|uniref:DNA-binding transcriptional regulator NtrC n=1 Tax=Thiosulfativibrio zosterae TaxID=2675053 RepID=A0A6F8PNT3_9GAMM|nr:nitrogen regulation protein NR(I) [Thiosulfativibrio zosterae]BBP43704.1 nitrogen regulation protein NR(I) [Thiosulfativibrio zosterae]
MIETKIQETTPVIWVVDDDASIRWVLDAALEDRDYIVRSFDSPLTALQNMHEPPTVVISDVRMPEMDGLTFMEAVHEINPSIPVIIMTAHTDLDTAVKSFQSKAFDYLPKPFEIEDALALIDRAVRRQLSGGKSGTRKKRTTKQPLNIIGSAPTMQEVFRILGRVSQVDVTVLINGETGTGKELVAKALHELSRRADQPFVAINSAAIPRELLESELFGHEKGSFTGAHTQRIGRFEEANGGTLFLDEIGDMPVDLQTRLLRVLNDGTFYRVGGKLPIKTDVRVVAATHRNMEEMVRQGKFREDLLYRFNVIRIKVPALRERRDDIPALLSYYLSEEAKQYNLDEKTLSKEVEAYLSTLPWPGNVRQLRSVCTWLTIMAPDKEVHMDDLPLELQGGSSATQLQTTEQDDWLTPLRLWAEKFLYSGKDGLHTEAEGMFERVLIEEAMKASLNHRQKAARLMGWGRNTLTRKTQALGMDD